MDEIIGNSAPNATHNPAGSKQLTHQRGRHPDHDHTIHTPDHHRHPLRHGQHALRLRRGKDRGLQPGQPDPRPGPGHGPPRLLPQEGRPWVRGLEQHPGLHDRQRRLLRRAVCPVLPGVRGVEDPRPRTLPGHRADAAGPEGPWPLTLDRDRRPPQKRRLPPGEDRPLSPLRRDRHRRPVRVTQTRPEGIPVCPGAGRPEPLRGPDGRRQPETGYRAGEADGDDDRVRKLWR